MPNIGDQFNAAFADTLGNLDQESQLLHQQICGAKHMCTLLGLPLDGATNHRCQNCGKKIHGPCGIEYDEDNGVITIAAKGLSFEFTMLKSPDIGAPVPHQICFLCVDELQRAQQTINNNNNNKRTICNPIAASATHPSVLALFPDMPNDTPRDLVDEMLQNAMDGNSGTALELKWQQFFGISNNTNDTEVEHQPGQRLQHMRDNFNVESVRKSSKAPKTFTKHQNQNELFILHLFNNEGLHTYLNPTLVHELTDINTEVDYSSVEAAQRKYKKNGGKKSLPERKEEYRIKLLRQHISYALNEPGMIPRQETVVFKALEENVNVFIQYIVSQRKNNNHLLKAKTYSGYRSSLTHLFKRYRHTPSREFEDDLGTCMEGVKRYSTEANGHGEGNVWDGDRPLTWELYEYFNQKFMEMGNDEGLFAGSFSKLTVTLACRGHNTGQIVLKQMTWAGDSIAIPFGHEKGNQTGSNPIKKMPRHCYANALNPRCDLPSSLFHYMSMNPDVIAHGDEQPLFNGSLKAQADCLDGFYGKFA